ncbi:hypothetical protein [Corynebacterium sp.]|uniref:hypothetical protein n=1 Tax=Corynebacterium sp. TaxID=1720 RepID=UPI0026DCFC19|nr:hypothetical protein [Corynebacterium sp.]MDO5033097.1 hypothetical protein [Corynebacterium sp.]
MASDVTFPLLDAADAERLLNYSSSLSAGYELPSAEYTHIEEQINRVLVDDVFQGSAEDAVAAAYYLFARENLRKAAGVLDDVHDSYRVVCLGALTGMPALVAVGYERVGRIFNELSSADEAMHFAAKSAYAGSSKFLDELIERKRQLDAEQAAQQAQAQRAEQEAPATQAESPASPRTASPSSAGLNEVPEFSETYSSSLRKRLDAAKSGDVRSHGAQFVEINDDIVASAFPQPAAAETHLSGSLLAQALTITLESAVGALWAESSTHSCQRVAAQSLDVFNALRATPAYEQLPSQMLGRFYSDAAAALSTDPQLQLDCYKLAARSYSDADNTAEELAMLLKVLEQDLLKNDRAFAHDLLASRYVDAMKLREIPVSAKWIVHYSETLRTEAENMYKSTQVLLDFLDKHPAAEASTPAEYNGLAEAAELLGDRYAAGNDAEHSRSLYHFAFNLFSAAGNTAALNSLSAKA